MQRPTAPPNRRWTNRQVTREIDHRGARWLWKLLLGVVLAAIPTGFYLFQQNQCLSARREVNELRTRLEQLSAEERRLQVQRASLEALDEIEAWALEQHGMVRPPSDRIVVIRRAPPRRGDLVARGPLAAGARVRGE